MPIIPSTAPYPTAGDVLNRARAITNDAARTIAGNLLADAQPYTIEDLNAAYEDVQEELANRGYETLTADTVIQNIPACDPTVQNDPGVQLWISFANFFDGVNLTDSTNGPVLPSDMIIPLRLWERQSGTVQQFIPMQPVNDGLPSINRSGYLRYWDWIDDRIYFIGSNQQEELRIRYIKFLPTITAPTDLVMIFRSKNAIAYKIAEIFARSRGSMLADSFAASSLQYVKKIAARTARKKQRGQHRRKPYGANGGSGTGFGLQY